MKRPLFFKTEWAWRHVLISVAMLIFGFYAIFLKSNPQIHPVIFLFAFQVVGLITWGAKWIHEGRHMPKGKTWLLLFALAFVAVGNDLAYFAGFSFFPPVAPVALGHQMHSVFLVLLVPFIMKKNLTGNEWKAIVVAVVGLVVLFGNQIGIDADMRGIGLGVLSAFFLAFLFVLYPLLNDRGLDVTAVNTWRFLFSTAMLIPFVPFVGATTLTITDYGTLALFGILFAFVASGMHNYAMSDKRELPPIHASIIGKSEPIIAIVYARMFFGSQEPITLAVILGAILIVGAGIWLAFQEKTETQT